jgi:hypothetical protein
VLAAASRAILRGGALAASVIHKMQTDAGAVLRYDSNVPVYGGLICDGKLDGNRAGDPLARQRRLVDDRAVGPLRR